MNHDSSGLDWTSVHLTPRGDWSELFVDSISTSELVVRSAGGADVPFDFETAALCLESDDGADLSSEDWAGNPLEGAAVYYLVRAENVCPLDGTGPVGWDSRHRPRPSRACP